MGWLGIVMPGCNSPRAGAPPGEGALAEPKSRRRNAETAVGGIERIDQAFQGHARRLVATQHPQGDGAAVVPGSHIVPVPIMFASHRNVGIGGRNVEGSLLQELGLQRGHPGTAVDQSVEQGQAVAVGMCSRLSHSNAGSKRSTGVRCPQGRTSCTTTSPYNRAMLKMLRAAHHHFEGYRVAIGCLGDQRGVATACANPTPTARNEAAWLIS